MSDRARYTPGFPIWAHSSARLERVPDKDEVRGSSPRGPTTLMRSVTYSMSISLDGYIVGPDGSFDWTMPDEVFRF